MRIFSYRLVLLSVLVLASQLSAAVQAQQDKVTIIAGTVSDEGGDPLPGVKIHVEGSDLSDVVTRDNGSYRFVIVGMREATLRFSLPGYQALTRSLVLNGGQVPLDLQLASLRPQLRMTAFQSGKTIQGRVVGLDPHSYGAYKVLVYVLTNKWYIHPEAVDTPSDGYALIEANGTWWLRTVRREHQATKVAFLLVPRTAWAPPVLELVGAGRPEAVLSQVEGVETTLVIDAPRGI